MTGPALAPRYLDLQTSQFPFEDSSIFAQLTPIHCPAHPQGSPPPGLLASPPRTYPWHTPVKDRNTSGPFFYSKPYYFVEPEIPAYFKPLSDEQWLCIYHLFPSPFSPLGGRPAIDDRRVLDGILFKFTTGFPWYDLPAGYPSWQTCYRRFRLWLRQGILHQVFGLLYADLCQRGGVDLIQALKDGSLGFVWEADRWRIHCPPELASGWRQSIAIFTVRFFTYLVRSRPRLIRGAPNANETYEIAMQEMEPSLLHRFHDPSDPYEGWSVHIDPEIRRRFPPEIDPYEIELAQSPPSKYLS